MLPLGFQNKRHISRGSHDVLQGWFPNFVYNAFGTTPLPTRLPARLHSGIRTSSIDMFVLLSPGDL